jgi:hypothetical protein
MPQGRPDIPSAMKREVRQRCGFGCVICGLPLYTYEHMEEWAVVRRHVADELTLLCDQHQREKTGGLLPKDAVRQANASPINLRQGACTPYALHFSGSTAEVEIGGNLMISPVDGDCFQMIPIIIDHTHLIEFTRQSNHLLLSLKLFDDRNQLAMEILENELVYSIHPWDITLIGRALTIREGRGQILFEIEFVPPGKIILTRGRLSFNGIEVKITAEQLDAPGFSCRGTRMLNTTVGVCLNSPRVTAQCMYRNDHAPRRKVREGRAHVWAADALARVRPGDALPGLPPGRRLQ